MRALYRVAMVFPFVGGSLWSQSLPAHRATAFTLSSAELRLAMAAMPMREGHSVAVLVQEQRVVVDEAGRRTSSTHQIFRVDQMSNLDYWSMIRVAWSAWLEERPQIRARVVTPEGAEIALDPSTIGEFTTRPQTQDILTDRKELRAPLPKLTQGAVVELETVTKEVRAFTQAGVRGSWFFWLPAPVEHSRFILEASAAKAFTWKIVGISGQTVKKQAQGERAIYELDLGTLLPPKNREPFQAMDQEPFIGVRYSSVPSWQSVAAEYAGIVEERLKGAELGDLARSAVAGAKDRADIIDRLLAQVQKTVRYTGIEFGESSIVPQPPAEVLRRGYGDCKDKATLLVGLLRTQGIQAHVALLWATSDEDVDPDLPGLGWFDHAIVYLPGKTPMWIDPTVRHALAGHLPVADQGRLALIAAPMTKGLLKTSSAPASNNLTRRTVDVYFAEEGVGRVVSSTEAFGDPGLSFRAGYSGADPEQTQNTLNQYSTQTYKSKSIDQISVSPTEDLKTPFRIVFHAKDAGIVLTGTRDAVVSMNPWPLVNTFDTWIRPDAQGNGSATSSGLDPKGRRTDAVFPQAYVNETHWVLHPPAGYAPGPLPDPQTFAFSMAKLTITHGKRADGLVEVVMRFESPERRWSVAQIKEARTALETYQAGKIPRLFFQQIGEVHLAAGRIQEALDEFRRGVEARPDQVAAWSRLSRAQLSAGLGFAGRASARKAIEVGPKNPASYEALGLALQYDMLGRRFKPGWDRTGAIAAYREALRLEPGRRGTRWDLGIVLERGEDGTRHTGGGVEEAVGIYKALVAEEKQEDLEDLLVAGLAALGRFEEARTWADSHPGVQKWQAWSIAMLACAKGAPAAIAQAHLDIPNPGTRGQTLLAAGNQIVRYRKYAEAAALIQEGASAAEQVSQARSRGEWMAKVHVSSASKLNPRDPRMAPLRFYAAVMDAAVDEKKVRSFLSAAQPAPRTPSEWTTLRRRVQYQTQLQGLSNEVFIDTLLSVADVSMEGSDEKGYRVDIQLPGARHAVFVAAEDGVYKVVGMEGEAPCLGRQAAFAAARGNLKEAGAWLDRARDLFTAPTPGGDPLAAHPMFELRHQGQVQTASDLRLAAAATVVMAQYDADMMSVLKEAYGKASPGIRRGVLGMAIAHGFLRKGYSVEAESIIRQLYATYPRSGTSAWLKGRILILGNKWRELLELADGYLKNLPEDSTSKRWKAIALVHLNRYAESEALLSSMMGQGKGTVTLFNDLAWAHVSEGRANDRTLEYARRATQDVKDQSLETLHTLAATLADMGRMVESRETMLKLIDLSFKDEPRSEDWYVLGLIAEHYGEKEAAKDAFQRLFPMEDLSLTSDKRNVVTLTKNHLRALGVKGDLVAPDPLPSEEQSRSTMEETCRAYYKAHQTEFSLPASYDCRMLLVRVSAKPNFQGKAVSESEALETVAKVKQLLASGKSLAELTATYSDDPGSKGRGGLYQDVAFGTFVAEIEAAVRTQPIGKVGEAIRTAYGFCFLQVVRIQSARVKPYEEVMDGIRKRLFQSEAGSYH